MPTSYTRKQIRTHIHDEAYAASRMFRKMRRGPDVTGLTEFTDAMTSVTDTALKDVMTVPQNLVGSWIRLMYVDDGSVSQERISRINQFDPSAGTLTFSPAIGTVNANAGSVNGEYEIWPDIHPDFVDSTINNILSSLRFLSHLPVTLIPDGDMEDSYTLGTSENFTQWWKVNSPTSAAKSTTSYPFPFGRQYVDVVTGAVISRGVQSATIPVDDAETLYVAVMVQKTPATSETGTFNVILYDVTNATALKTVTVSGQQPVIVYFQQAPSSTTEEVAVQVLGATASTVSFRVGPMLVWSDQRD